MTATPELTHPSGTPNYIAAVDPDARNQAQRRLDRNARDQHNRVWLITLEQVKTPRGGLGLEVDICGGPPAIAGWLDGSGTLQRAHGDPLNTPSTYFRLGRDEFGAVVQSRLTILYDTWIETQTNEDEQWFNFFWSIAALKFPGGIEADAALKHPWLLQLAGPRPWPRPSVIRLAATGHEGFLGKRALTSEESALLGKQLKSHDLLQEFLGKDNPTLTGEGAPVTAADVAETIETAPLTPPEALTYKDFFVEGRKRGLAVTEIAAAWREHREALKGEA